MSQTPKIKILLVDDNPYFLAAVRRFLILLPDMVVIAEAHDGKDALTKAEQLQPDLVLLDIGMPELNGIEVARSMKEWPHPPRIVFLSMHDNAAYREAAQELGVIGLVGKTDFVAGLLPIIRNMLAVQPAPPAAQ